MPVGRGNYEGGSVPCATGSHDLELNLFYEEGDPDRWIRGDRLPRRIMRRIVRGKPQPGGQMRVFLNLRLGLDHLGIRYRVNDYRNLRSTPQELASVIGKPFVLNKIPSGTPILFGAAGYNHPLDDSDLLSRHNIRAILVPCEWMRLMCEPYWGEKVQVWPVGIDTDLWSPDPIVDKDIDVVVYDKIRWRRDEYRPALLEPALTALDAKGLRVVTVRYGTYREDEFIRLVKRSRALIFLCEHETQGLALLQTLSCDVPILAWDRGGYWQDPAYYPHRVRFGPVTTVPYWDERCGQTFQYGIEVSSAIESFWAAVSRDAFRPRQFILENLTLDKCAQRYTEIANRLEVA
jgi:glycosyltransferase involved in cell wall biosynthesis